NDANIGVGAYVNKEGAIDVISQMQGSGASGAAGTYTMDVSGAVGGLASGSSDLVASGDSTIAAMDLTTVQGSQKAIIVIDQAIQSIDAQRADLGAVQNRFENTIGNLQNISENVSAARGRIQDTDFASETA